MKEQEWLGKIKGLLKQVTKLDYEKVRIYCEHTDACTHAYTQTHTYTHTCTCVPTHVYTHTHTYIHMHVQTYTYNNTRTYTHNTLHILHIHTIVITTGSNEHTMGYEDTHTDQTRTH